MKKTLATIALAGSLALVGTAPAMASYPAPAPVPPQAAVSDNEVGPGEQFIFRGQGPFRGESLTIRVTPGNPPAASGAGVGNRAVGSRINVFVEAQTLAGQADAEGNFSVPITIKEAGTYSITATGNTTGATVGPVTVVVDTGFASTANSGTKGNAGVGTLSNSGSGLAATGADSGLVLWTLVGAGALAAGATSVVVVRRRAKSAVAA